MKNNTSKKGMLIVTILMIVIIGITISGCFNRNGMPSKEEFQAAIDGTWSESIGSDDPDFLKAIDEISSYKIVSIEEGEFYTINVKVTGIDLGVELDGMDQSLVIEGEEAMNAYLLELIGRCSQVETETVVYATLTDDGIQITFSDTFVDAMSGKIYSYYTQKIEEMMGGS